MNWEAISAIGEIVGAVAVVVTLIYVARQIRDNTRVARSATRQSVAEMTMSIADDLVADKEMAKLFLKDLQGDELDASERLRLFARTYRAMRNYENIHYQYLTGMLTASEWQGFRSNLNAIFEWPSTQAYWENERQYYSQPFQTEVSAILEELAARDELSHSYLVDEDDSEEPVAER
jgi:AICAR transformylase/IMP cyclohydrolase PurH